MEFLALKLPFVHPGRITDQTPFLALLVPQTPGKTTRPVLGASPAQVYKFVFIAVFNPTNVFFLM